LIIACAVLAAGGSSRLGRPKQLLSMAGEPLLQRILRAATAARCQHVAVVLGASAAQIEQALGPSRAELLHNERWASEGMASSLHVAVHWARAHAADALLLAACDQPHLTVVQLDALITVFERERRTVASRYSDTLGVPALVEARLFDALLGTRGDRGAGSVLRSDASVLALDWPEGALDLDTQADVERFLAHDLTARARPSRA
jgi:xanthine dehydrogenase accessory factor